MITVAVSTVAMDSDAGRHGEFPRPSPDLAAGDDCLSASGARAAAGA